MVRRDKGSGTVLRDTIRPGITRGLDFVILEELRKRTSIMPNEVLKFAMSEMLCNSLDTEATEIKIQVQQEGDFHKVSVSDNGTKKLTPEELTLIVDFKNKSSSKRGFLMVSRGYLGNALKCIYGYSYALAELHGLKAPNITVESGDRQYTITLQVDRVREIINSKIETRQREDDCFTTFTIKFPKFNIQEDDHPSRPSVMEDLIFATSMVNPSRRISYKIFGRKGVYGTPEGEDLQRRETSILWYKKEQFVSLYKDFVRAKPDAKLKEFIPLFRGFTGKKVMREILQELNGVNHDCQDPADVQFFPATSIQDVPVDMITELYKIMKRRAKPISKRSTKVVLGCIGEQSFENLRQQHGWQRLRYVLIPARRLECATQRFYRYYEEHKLQDCKYSLEHVEFPYLVELAVFDRYEDGEGLKVFQCVNFMASMEDLFSRIFNVSYRLGRVGITKETPVTVILHLVCPVLKWLNYGKSGLDD